MGSACIKSKAEEAKASTVMERQNSDVLMSHSEIVIKMEDKKYCDESPKRFSEVPRNSLPLDSNEASTTSTTSVQLCRTLEVNNDVITSLGVWRRHKDDYRLLCGTSSGSIAWFALSDLPQDRKHQGIFHNIHSTSITALCPLRNGYFASGSNDKTISIISSSGREVGKLYGHGLGIKCLLSTSCSSPAAFASSPAIEPSSETLLSTSRDGSIRLWNVEKKLCISNIWEENNYMRCLTNFPFDGNSFIGCCEKRTIRIFDTREKDSIEMRKILPIRHMELSNAIDVALDNTTIAICGVDSNRQNVVSIYDSRKLQSPVVPSMKFSTENNILTLNEECTSYKSHIPFNTLGHFDCSHQIQQIKFSGTSSLHYITANGEIGELYFDLATHRASISTIASNMRDMDFSTGNKGGMGNGAVAGYSMGGSGLLTGTMGSPRSDSTTLTCKKNVLLEPNQEYLCGNSIAHIGMVSSDTIVDKVQQHSSVNMKHSSQESMKHSPLRTSICSDYTPNYQQQFLFSLSVSHIDDSNNILSSVKLYKDHLRM